MIYSSLSLLWYHPYFDIQWTLIIEIIVDCNPLSEYVAKLRLRYLYYLYSVIYNFYSSLYVRIYLIYFMSFSEDITGSLSYLFNHTHTHTHTSLWSLVTVSMQLSDQVLSTCRIFLYISLCWAKGIGDLWGILEMAVKFIVCLLYLRGNSVLILWYVNLFTPVFLFIYYYYYY